MFEVCNYSFCGQLQSCVVGTVVYVITLNIRYDALYSNHSLVCSLYVCWRHCVNASCINDLHVKYGTLAALCIMFQFFSHANALTVSVVLCAQHQCLTVQYDSTQLLFCAVFKLRKSLCVCVCVNKCWHIMLILLKLDFLSSGNVL